MIKAMPMPTMGATKMMRKLITAWSIVCSLDFSEDPYLDGKDDCDNCYGSDDLKI